MSRLTFVTYWVHFVIILEFLSVKTVLAYVVACSEVAANVESQTTTFCSSCRIATIYSPKDLERKSTLIRRIAATVNSQILWRSTIMKYEISFEWFLWYWKGRHTFWSRYTGKLIDWQEILVRQVCLALLYSENMLQSSYNYVWYHLKLAQNMVIVLERS